jgi:hypothetical protein
MKPSEIYPLVYEIVRRAQKENTNLRDSIGLYEWSKRIPKPLTITDEIAEAICISVSSSGIDYGLEILFQEKVYLKDLRSASLDNQIPHLLSEISSDGNRFKELGYIIRELFKHRNLILSEREKEMLQKL